MENKINTETLNRLIALYRNDAGALEAITDALDSFEKYHQAIYKLENQRRLYTQGAMSPETYRVLIPELDVIRTRNHNEVISQVSMLNRLAEKNSLSPFYDGIVSKEPPIRTHIADAVLAFVRQVIADRITGGR